MDSPAQSFTSNYSSENPMKLDFKKILVVLALLALGIFAWMYLSSPLLTNVTGVGEVSAPATNATISFSITANDATAQNAITNVNAKALSMTEFLKTKGIAGSDIAEGEVTAVPAGLITQGATGFQASITMAAKTTHVSTISTLISELYINGAVVVSQPVLSVENRADLEQTAYETAMSDARSQAGKIALSNWKLLKKIVAITQTTSGGTSTATTKPGGTDTGASQTAVENGVFKIGKTVTVTYKMW